ncbi:hypothetical protein ARMSODRAFT_797474 [Armillaria solidipes]|uniref:Uncharacterized protein n=1 Tax=Armillaria solidipes TaxID=1076256 RepID=A0A2H3BMA3_9AGAR|nr:hypothetical protein ARMSODRAFT_797474 [Armillaria solidipes]
MSSNIPLSLETILRLGTIAICIYDYVRTLPAEYKFWRDKGPQIRLNLVLFVLIRYVSIITLVISNVGYFSHSFSAKACKNFYMASVVMKVLQTTICQFILGIRAYSISRRSDRVRIFLIVFTVLITVLEWFTNLYGRIMIQSNGNCTSGNDPSKLVNWTFYIWAMLYDMATLGISTYYLFRASANGLSSMTGLVKAMIVDGLGYILILTVSNTLNLVLYRASKLDAQAAAASLGFAFTWIMSQNILIKTRDAGMRSMKSRNPSSGRNNAFSTSRSDDQTAGGPVTTKGGIELEVQVRIDREHDSADGGRIKWDDARSDWENHKMGVLAK